MNKFITLLIVFTFAAASLTTIAADKNYTTSKSKVVSINPLSLTYGRINAALEMKMGTDNSFTVTAGYWDWGWDYYALNVGAIYKWYIDAFEEKKSALNGLAVGPRADLFYNSYNGRYASDYDSYTTITIGAEVSYKWVFGEGKWAVEPNFSFGIPVTKKRYGYSFQNWGWGVNIGYCF